MLRNFSGAFEDAPRAILGKPPISLLWSFFTELTQSRCILRVAPAAEVLGSLPLFFAVTLMRSRSADFLGFSIPAFSLPASLLLSQLNSSREGLRIREELGLGLGFWGKTWNLEEEGVEIKLEGLSLLGLFGGIATCSQNHTVCRFGQLIDFSSFFWYFVGILFKLHAIGQLYSPAEGNWRETLKIV